MAVASCNAASCDLGTGLLDGFFDGSPSLKSRKLICTERGYAQSGLMSF